MARETIDPEISPLVIPYPLTRFPHLWAAGNYCAGYYTYLWSGVLDAQAYASFETQGPNRAGRMLKGILETGGAVEATKLFTDTYGPIDIKYLLRRVGVAVSDAAQPGSGLDMRLA